MKGVVARLMRVILGYEGLDKKRAVIWLRGNRMRDEEEDYEG